ncbi:hypothetical protein ACFQNE_16475 [Gordonia phosphorivorans]|uniref:Alternate-type signal peptide domain-containing protein n=1 Tax=Gordonia phosphorivorans TaxID=1056982 RepID=A0ABV6HBV2_9ACTN
MKPQLKWALAAAAVLLVGFFSIQQTGALWRSEVPGGGASTVTAGKLDISVGDGVKAFDLSGLTLPDASPGDSVQKPLPVINSGNVKMSYKLNSVGVQAEAGKTAAPLLVRVAKVANEAACTPTEDVGEVLYNGAASQASTAARTVPANTTEVLCLRVTIADNAGVSQSSNATFTFGASSVSGA